MQVLNVGNANWLVLKCVWPSGSFLAFFMLK